MHKKTSSKLRNKLSRVQKRYVKQRGALYFFKNLLTPDELLMSPSRVAAGIYGLGTSYSFQYSHLFGFKFGAPLSSRPKDHSQ